MSATNVTSPFKVIFFLEFSNQLNTYTLAYTFQQPCITVVWKLFGVKPIA